jgi:hypothetical protein
MVPFAAGLVFWAPHVHGQELHDTTLQQIASSTYVAAGVLLVVLMTLQAQRR